MSETNGIKAMNTFARNAAVFCAEGFAGCVTTVIGGRLLETQGFEAKSLGAVAITAGILTVANTVQQAKAAIDDYYTQ